MTALGIWTSLMNSPARAEEFPVRTQCLCVTRDDSPPVVSIITARSLGYRSMPCFYKTFISYRNRSMYISGSSATRMTCLFGDPMMDISESLQIEEADAPVTRVLTTKSVNCIGYWNVRTMYEVSKSAQVIKAMDSYEISILGLSEVCWTKTDHLHSWQSSKECSCGMSTSEGVTDKGEICDSLCQSLYHPMLCTYKWSWGCR